MLSDLTLKGGALRKECLKSFPHLQVLTCWHVAFENFLPYHQHLTFLALEDCRVSFSGVMGHIFPRLRVLFLASFEATLQHLLKTDTLVYLSLRELKILDADELALPPRLSTLIIDHDLLLTVRILGTAPRLHRLRVAKPFVDAGQDWPPERLDMTTFASVQDLELGQWPSSELSLPPDAKLTLHNCLIGRHSFVKGLSSLRCVVLSGVHNLQEDLEAFFDSLSSIEDLSINGFHLKKSQRFSRLPQSLLRFTVRCIRLQEPAAILTATHLIQLTINDCEVEDRLAPEFKLSRLEHLRSLTVLGTPGLKAMQIPPALWYHHDHSAE